MALGHLIHGTIEPRFPPVTSSIGGGLHHISALSPEVRPVRADRTNGSRDVGRLRRRHVEEWTVNAPGDARIRADGRVRLGRRVYGEAEAKLVGVRHAGGDISLWYDGTDPYEVKGQIDDLNGPGNASTCTVFWVEAGGGRTRAPMVTEALAPWVSDAIE